MRNNVLETSRILKVKRFWIALQLLQHDSMVTYRIAATSTDPQHTNHAGAETPIGHEGFHLILQSEVFGVSP